MKKNTVKKIISVILIVALLLIIKQICNISITDIVKPLLKNILWFL